jgi:hypothetical protein
MSPALIIFNTLQLRLRNKKNSSPHHLTFPFHIEHIHFVIIQSKWLRKKRNLKNTFRTAPKLNPDPMGLIKVKSVKSRNLQYKSFDADLDLMSYSFYSYSLNLNSKDLPFKFLKNFPNPFVLVKTRIQSTLVTSSKSEKVEEEMDWGIAIKSISILGIITPN